MRRLLICLSLLGLVSEADAYFPVIRDVAVATETVNATDHPIPNPTTTVVGDYAIVWLGADGATTTFTWPSSSYCTGNAWTEIQAETRDATPAQVSTVRACVLDEVMSGTHNVNSGAGSEMASMVVIVIHKDTFTGSLVAGTAVTATTGQAPDPPSLTSGFGAVDTLWFIYAVSDGGNAIRAQLTTPDRTWHGRIVSIGTTNAASSGIGVMFKNLSAASLDPGADIIMVQNSDENHTNTFALQGAEPAACSSSGNICIIGGQ